MGLLTFGRVSLIIIIVYTRWETFIYAVLTVRAYTCIVQQSVEADTTTGARDRHVLMDKPRFLRLPLKKKKI
jgi:hypothetical protein